MRRATRGGATSMFVVIGAVLVLSAVLGGFMLAGGKPLVLFQPAEFLIILGAAAGAMLIANPILVLKQIVHGALRLLKPSRYTPAFYLECLKMLNELFVYSRKNGMAKLEADIDEPEKSPVFQKYPFFLSDRAALGFLCDTVRTSISGGVSPFDLDQMMETDLEAQSAEGHEPVTALSTMADSLPGLGIVAAVLGVVVTMGALGGPPEEIGHKVAAALVGTFLGILACYGFIGPLAQNLTKRNHEDAQYLQFLRLAVLAFVKGLAPMLAVEFARRGLPPHMRPTFREMEQRLKGGTAAAKAA